MSPKPLISKAVRPEMNQRDNAKGGHSRSEAVHTNIHSLPQATKNNGYNNPARVRPQKRRKPHDSHLGGIHKKAKQEHTHPAAPKLLSKPAVGGAASHRLDPSQKEPGTQSSILRSNVESLKEQVRTLRKLPLNVPGDMPLAGPRIDRATFGEFLDDAQVTLAIAAITEAVNKHYGKDMFRWSLLSSTTLNAAQTHPPWERADFPRLVRSKLVFPMFWGPQRLSLYPGFEQDCKMMVESDQNHIFLVKVLFNRGEMRLPQLVILDSCPGFLDRLSLEWRLVVSEMRRVVTNLGIWDPPTLPTKSVPPLQSYPIAFEEEIELEVARQQNHWACGVHTILNAWADALLYRTNPACKMDKTSYEHAVEVINLVLEGRANIRLVTSLLIGTGFVLLENTAQGLAVTEMRKGSKHLREYHQISSTADLDTLIVAQSLEAKQSLKVLAHENKPDPELAEHVARWLVLPRLRKIVLEEKVEAAEGAAKKAAKKAAERAAKNLPSNQEEKEEKKPGPVSRATVRYFHSMSRVSGSRTATQCLTDLQKHLSNQSLITTYDDEEDAKIEREAESRPLREAQDGFIRHLADFMEFEKGKGWWMYAGSDLFQAYFEYWLDTMEALDKSLN